MEIQLNLSTMATLGTEGSDHCREVLNKSQYVWIFCSTGQKNGRFREVIVSGGSTIALADFQKEGFDSYVSKRSF